MESSVAFPEQGRLAGIDYGTVRIGVAITDPARTLASPFDNYVRRTLALDAAYFKRLVQDEKVAGFVVGLPVHNSGEESEKSREVRQFGDWLTQITSLPVRYHDERYSSVLAEEALQGVGFSKKQRQQRLDKLAAQFILSAYLESAAAGNQQQAMRGIEDRD